MINSYRKLLCNSLLQIHKSTNAGYKSAVNLTTIYPNSSLDITKKQEIPKTEGNVFSGFIPTDKLTITYSRSSGPGGQNVNKVNSKVDLRFHLNSAEWLSQELKDVVAKQNHNSITSEGYLIVKSEKTRSQQLNLADAMDKLRHMIHTSVHIPIPLSQETVERHRRKHEAASRERLRQKREKSFIKNSRRCDES